MNRPMGSGVRHESLDGHLIISYSAIKARLSDFMYKRILESFSRWKLARDYERTRQSISSERVFPTGRPQTDEQRILVVLSPCPETQARKMHRRECRSAIYFFHSIFVRPPVFCVPGTVSRASIASDVPQGPARTTGIMTP